MLKMLNILLLITYCSDFLLTWIIFIAFSLMKEMKMKHDERRQFVIEYFHRLFVLRDVEFICVFVFMSINRVCIRDGVWLV